MSANERRWFDGSDCPDWAFAHFGDMYTPNELRHADLHDPRLREQRDEYLARCVAAGIGDDQDPSLFLLEIPVMVEDTAETWTERTVAAFGSASGIRWGTPEDARDGESDA